MSGRRRLQLPAEVDAKLSDLHPRMRSPRLKRAVTLAWSGLPTRDAAQAVGYASHQDIARLVRELRAALPESV